MNNTSSHSESRPSALRSRLHVSAHAPALPPSGAGAEPAAPPCTLDFTASNESLDRAGEIISARGWRLEQYRRNPVFQNAHQYGDILHTLGRAIITEVRGGALFQRVQFAVEASPVARIAHALYAGGFLNAVSVGFIPVRWENGAEKSGWRRKYLEQELLEVSAVAIPANPDALRLGLEAGAVRREDLRDAADLFSAMAAISRAEAPSPHPSTLICGQSAHGSAASAPARPLPAGTGTDWPRLARRFREVLRR